MPKTQKWLKSATLILALAMVFCVVAFLRIQAHAESMVTYFVSTDGDDTTGADESTAFQTIASACSFANKQKFAAGTTVRLIVVDSVQVSGQSIDGGNTVLDSNGNRLNVLVTSLSDADEDEFAQILLCYHNPGNSDGSQMLTFTNNMTLRNIKVLSKDFKSEGYYVSGSTTNVWTTRYLYAAGSQVTLDNTVFGTDTDRPVQWYLYANSATALSETAQKRLSGITLLHRDYGDDVYPGTTTKRINRVCAVSSSSKNDLMNCYVTVGEGASLCGAETYVVRGNGTVSTATFNVEAGGKVKTLLAYYQSTGKASDTGDYLHLGDPESRGKGARGLVQFNIRGTVEGSVVGGGYGNGTEGKPYYMDIEVNLFDGCSVTGSVTGIGGYTYATQYGDYTLNMYGGKVGTNLVGTGNKIQQKIYGKIAMNVFGGEVVGSIFGTGNVDNAGSEDGKKGNHIYNDVTINISGGQISTKSKNNATASSGTPSYLFGMYKSYVHGTVNLNISGGEVYSSVICGLGDVGFATVENINMNISGGSVTPVVYSSGEAKYGFFLGGTAGTVEKNLRITISGGSLISSGKEGTQCDIYLLGKSITVNGDAYLTVTGGEIAVKKSGGTPTAAGIYMGGHDVKVKGTYYATLLGGTFDNSDTGKGAIFLGGRSTSSIFRREVNVIGSEDKTRYPVFTVHSSAYLVLTNNLGQLGNEAKETAFPADGTINDEIVLDNTVNYLEFPGSVYFGGSSANAANFTQINGSVKNVLRDGLFGKNVYFGGDSTPVYGNITSVVDGGSVSGVVVMGTYKGSISGHVHSTINDLTIASSFYCGCNNTATVGNGIETEIYGYRSASEDKAIFAGNASSNVSLSSDPEKAAPYAVQLTVGRLGDSDDKIYIDGGIWLGNGSGQVQGPVRADFFSGTQRNNRHLMLGGQYGGSANGAADTPVLGDVTANVYGGSWGTVFMGPRNLNRNVSGYSVEGSVILNVYGGTFMKLQKGMTTSSKTCCNVRDLCEARIYLTQDDVTFLTDLRGLTTALSSNNLSDPFKVYVIPGDHALILGKEAPAVIDGLIGTDANGVANKTVAAATPLIVRDNEGWLSGRSYLYLPAECDADDVIVETAVSGTIEFTGIGTAYSSSYAIWKSKGDVVPVLYASNLVMDSTTGVQFFYDKGDVDAYIARTGAWSYTISYKGKNQTETFTSAAELTEAGGLYVIRMDQGVVATDYAKTITVSSSSAAALQTCVFDLARAGVEAYDGVDEDNANLFRAIYNYGIAAADCFGTPSGLTPYAGVTYTGTYAGTADTTVLVDGYRFYGTSLSLQDQVRLNYYVKLPDGVSVSDVTFTAKRVDGVETELDVSLITVTDLSSAGNANYDLCVSVAPYVPDMDGDYRVEVSAGGVVAATCTRSIASACAAYIAGGTDYADLSAALLSYVEAAKAAL